MSKTLSLCALFVIATILPYGCGGGTQQPPPPPPSISVAMSTMPPSSVPASGTASIAATVSNDSANAGVTWSCSPIGSCGSFSPASTSSGANTTYTAPPAPPAGGLVTITATSVSDTARHANASVTIAMTASLATLHGQYAFFLSSPTGNHNTASLAGSLTFDGAGKITAGIQDYGPGAAAQADLSDPIMTGSYTVDPSGHGTLTYTTAKGKILKFSFAIATNSHALLIETDGNPGSGTLDLQSAGPAFAAFQFSGAYSFTMTGMDPVSQKKISTGGVFTADGTSGISSGTLDRDIGAAFSTVFFAGNFTAPDTNGRGTLTWNTGAALETYAYYVVTPKFLRLIRTDGVAYVAGTAYSQGAVGTTNAALSGNYVLQAGGWSNFGLGRTIIAGQIISDGAGKFTSGIADSVSGLGAGATQPVSGTYSFAGSTRGVFNLASAGVFSFNAHIYLADPTLNLLDPNSATGGGGALLVSSDALFIDGIGVLIPQSLPASATFAKGNHALNLTNTVDNATTLSEVDLAGVVGSDGASNFSGSVDYDQDASVDPRSIMGDSFTGMFTADAAHPGHFTGTFTVPAPAGSYGYIFGADTFQVSFYQISGSRTVIIVTEPKAVQADMDCTGYLLQQALQ